MPDYQTSTTFSVGYVANYLPRSPRPPASTRSSCRADSPAPAGGFIISAATDSAPGASGSFSYTAIDGDGTYTFYTVATDNAGNVEVTPSADADSATLLDTPAPPTSTASVPDYQTSTTFSVGYVANDPGCRGLRPRHGRSCQG